MRLSLAPLLTSLALAQLLTGCGEDTAAEPCTLVQNDDGSSTLVCPDGTSAQLPFPHGTCTVLANGDGTSTIRCEDGSEVVVRDGEPGLPGSPGADGRPGRDGEDGRDGRPGEDGQEGEDGEDGRSALIRVVPVEPGEGGCEGGGLAVLAGLDDDGDGLLDDEEIDAVEYLCHGADGEDGRDGEEGPPGTDGEDGEDGEDGTDGYDALVRLDPEPPGEHCPEGGVAISSGRDLDRNGVLDGEEIEDTQWVCNPKSYTFASWLDAPTELGAGVRTPAVLRARAYGVFDPHAALRWRLTATGASGEPLEQLALARPAPGEEELDFRQWTEVVSTDASGVAWLGTETGFTADEVGLLGLTGLELPLALVPAAPGPVSLRFDLVRLADGAVLGQASGSATALPITPRVEVLGLAGMVANTRTLIAVNGRLPVSLDPASTVRWRFTLARADGASADNVSLHYPAEGAEPAAHASWTDAVVTDPAGAASWPDAGSLVVGEWDFQTLEGAPFWFSFALPAGGYTLGVELLDDVGGSVLASVSRPFTVSDLPTQFTFQGFTGLTADTRGLVALNGRLDTTLPGTDIVRWRLRLLDDAGLPVEGASFYFDPLGGDLAGHATWTEAVVTDEAGEVFLGDPAGFPSAWAQVRDGITHHLSLALPEGGYLLALELVRLNDGAVLGSGDRAFTVGPAEPAGPPTP